MQSMHTKSQTIHITSCRTVLREDAADAAASQVARPATQTEQGWELRSTYTSGKSATNKQRWRSERPRTRQKHRKSSLQLCKVVGEPYQTGKLVNGNFTIQLLNAALQNQNG
jgi:hypothetical protein